MNFSARFLWLALMMVCMGCGVALAQRDAAALYKAKCQVCHGADGKGGTPAGQKLGVKDLHSPEIAKMSDSQLVAAVKKGKGKMQAYKDKLTDEQITELVKYVKTLK